MFTEFQFPYGDSALTARIPTKNIAFALKRKHARGLADETSALLEAVRHPTTAPPLSDCVSRGDKVVVIVTDNTRPCPDDRLLPPILAELEKKLPRENITIIVALGLHPPLSTEELIKKLGRNIVSGYRVLNHDATDTVNIGTTSRGTPVEVNRQVLEADFRISTGFIEPHFFAGFSGGSKSLSPGVGGPKSIYHNHGYEMIEHQLSRAGILQGNPVHEDIVEQAGMAGLNFIVNVLLNESKQITHVVAGDPVQAHEKGCQIERELAGVEVDHKVDITVTTNTGAPLDLDLYQTCKGIDSASLITRDGGIIIIASACNQGTGPEAFTRPHCSARSPAEVLQKLKLDSLNYLPWQNQRLANVQCINDIYLVSELDNRLVEDMMIAPVPSIEAGLEKAFQKLGADAEVAVIPEGHMVLPLLKGKTAN
ncbi:MAG: nickel-dependent lactate racemase [Chloroflexi bacterium]|nr:nickel-dependent lactate racemase [Chloroflexota bacterium]